MQQIKMGMLLTMLCVMLVGCGKVERINKTVKESYEKNGAMAATIKLASNAEELTLEEVEECSLYLVELMGEEEKIEGINIEEASQKLAEEIVQYTNEVLEPTGNPVEVSDDIMQDVTEEVEGIEQ